MVPNSGSKLPFLRGDLSDGQLATQIGQALQAELGASRRATKTVMRWTGVSDHTARSWLNGRTSPSGLHMLELAMQSEFVMMTLLRLTGHGELELGLKLHAIEGSLEAALRDVRLLRGERPGIGDWSDGDDKES